MLQTSTSNLISIKFHKIQVRWVFPPPKIFLRKDLSFWLGWSKLKDAWDVLGWWDLQQLSSLDQSKQPLTLCQDRPSSWTISEPKSNAAKSLSLALCRSPHGFWPSSICWIVRCHGTCDTNSWDKIKTLTRTYKHKETQRSATLDKPGESMTLRASNQNKYKTIQQHYQSLSTTQEPLMSITIKSETANSSRNTKRLRLRRGRSQFSSCLGWESSHDCHCLVVRCAVRDESSKKKKQRNMSMSTVRTSWDGTPYPLLLSSSPPLPTPQSTF